MAQEYEAAGCVVLGISFDAPDANKAFRDKFDFPFRLLSDWDEQVGVAYEVRDPGTEKVSFAKRYSYLIDPEGVIRRAYKVGDVAGHAAEVLRDLRELQSA
jgi:peroxiredoxin Q/BCP